MATPSGRRPTVSVTTTPDVAGSTGTAPNTPNSDRVEAKSGILRGALEARRARDAASTSRSVESIPTFHATPSSNASPDPSSKGSSVVPDPWLDQASSEQECTPSPRRARRRPSEPGIIVRTPTMREQRVDSEAMKNKLFNMSLQNELLKKQNNELKDKLEAANQRIDELEPLEDANIDLRETNDGLTLRLQNMEEDMEIMQEKLLDAEDQNRELLQIQEEAVRNMEKQNVAIEEAAELLFQFEKDKAKMQEEIVKLKAELEEERKKPEQFYDALDGQGRDKQPSRVHSIDESRPSTGNFDSDYYSQPESPPVKPRDSNEGPSYRDRANSLLDLSVKGKRSMQDMQKRVSVASVKSLRSREQSIASVAEGPEDPHLEPPYHAQCITPTPQNQPIVRGPTRTSSLAATTAPDSTNRTRSSHPGLRGHYHQPQAPERQSQSRRVTHSTIRSVESPLPPSLARHSYEQLAPATSTERIKEPLRERHESAPPEYSQSPAPTPSVRSDDLKGRPDPDRWWKGVGAVRSVVNQDQSPIARTAQLPPAYAPACHVKAALSPRRPERDLLFNAAEDEEQFIQKVKGSGYKGYLGRRH